MEERTTVPRPTACGPARTGEPREQEEEARRAFLADAVSGLTADPKRIPSKYFYDARGSELFERICRLPEYYPTRAELAIMRAHAGEMAAQVGPDGTLIELGSGSSLKTRLLLGRLASPAAYVPVDISGEFLLRSAAALREEFPGLRVVPVCADFTRPFEVPDGGPPARRRVVYFPGSTIGNFDPTEAAALLGGIARLVGSEGGLLIGVDLKKDAAVLEPAYNDAEGVTAAFNLNVLERLRKELGAEVRPDRFEHLAFYNEVEGRIEMHLRSLADQTIRLDGTTIRLEAGETIHTENSYKYDLEQFRRLAAAAGFIRRTAWTDPEGLFSVQHFERAAARASGRHSPDGDGAA